MLKLVYSKSRETQAISQKVFQHIAAKKSLSVVLSLVLIMKFYFYCCYVFSMMLLRERKNRKRKLTRAWGLTIIFNYALFMWPYTAVIVALFLVFVAV